VTTVVLTRQCRSDNSSINPHGQHTTALRLLVVTTNGLTCTCQGHICFCESTAVCNGAYISYYHLNCPRTADAAADFLRSSSCVPKSQSQSYEFRKTATVDRHSRCGRCHEGRLPAALLSVQTQPVMFVETQHPQPSRSQVTFGFLLLAQSTGNSRVAPVFTVGSQCLCVFRDWR
jgi:hypothetical protein